MTHPHEDDLVLHYYGELRGPDAGTLERHLRECATCRESFSRLEQVLRAVDESPVPEPSAEFELSVWTRLRPGIRAIQPSRPSAFGIRHSALIPRWVFAGGIAALGVIAFLTGALWRQTRPQPDATVPSATATHAAGTAELRERLLLAVVGEHLERTELVLIELLNARGPGMVAISAEQTRAQELALENRLYRQTAQSVGNLPVVSLLDQLDLILTEVAGGPSAIPAADLDAMRRRIEGQNLLFKVQVVRSALGAQERDAHARQARMTS
ncbi:MAG: hypothetical protein ACRD1S_03410 [Vicinamibacterales bacterium]